MDIEAWLERLCAELGVADIRLDDNDLRTLLDLARDAAHQVERLAAPLTTFLVGVAVGRGQDPRRSGRPGHRAGSRGRRARSTIPPEQRWRH